MSTREKLIKARLGMLALAEELQNISLACRRAGISRSHYYEIKEAFEKFGAEGLAEQPRRAPRMPNQTPPELEGKILEMTERYPTRSYAFVSQQLRLVGIGVSPSAVRYVWARHGLTLRFQRLLWLEQKTAAAGGVLTEAQIRLLRRHRGRLSLLINPSACFTACPGPDQGLEAWTPSASGGEILSEWGVAQTRWKVRATPEQTPGMNLRPVSSRSFVIWVAGNPRR
jgi:hypothetical protein